MQAIHFVNNHLPSHFAKPSWDRLLRVVERICDTVLITFALFTSPHYFLPGFILGFCWSIFDPNKKSNQNKHPGHGCAQSYLERMAGFTFPPLVRIAAEVGTIICHIDHHPVVFAPIIGFAAGTWSGEQCLRFRKKRTISR